MSALLNNRGQGLVETLIGLPIFLGFFAGLGYLLYYGMIHQVGGYHLHEALLCAQAQEIEICQNKHLKAVQRLLIFGESSQLKISRFAGTLQGDLRINLNPPLRARQGVSRGF